MTSAESICYTLINAPSVTDSEPTNETQLKSDIEHGDLRTKTEALKRVILMTLNGEKLHGEKLLSALFHSSKYFKLPYLFMFVWC